MIQMTCKEITSTSAVISTPPSADAIVSICGGCPRTQNPIKILLLHILKLLFGYITRNMERVSSLIDFTVFTVFFLILNQKNFQEDVCIYKKHHLHSEALCCNSTEVNSSFMSDNPPSQSNLNFLFFFLP